MKLRGMIKWIILGLSLFAVLSCSGGSSTDLGSGTIRLVSITPEGPYTDGDSEDFTVVVAYTMVDADEAEIYIGFGYRDGTTSYVYGSASEIVGPTSTEVTKTYTFSKVMNNYIADGYDENIFDVSLDPYPVEGTFTPYDGETLSITVN
ncbi:MAG: hypothetical protein PQJ50_09960 [Spirochaetales bacterium]|nr:hypothetical protein [Spirochaetales bacterium]